MNKNISLDVLFDNNFDCYTEFDLNQSHSDEAPAMTKEKFKLVVMEYSKQLLELAAENADTKDIMGMNCDDHTPYWGSCCNCGEYQNREIAVGTIVDVESITDTIKQII